VTPRSYPAAAPAPPAAPAVPPIRRLPLRFDAGRLAAEALALPAGAWVPHFNTAIYQGDWSGVALRAAPSAPLALYPDPTASAADHAATADLARCPAVATALADLRCPLLSARLLRLGPGARILAHRDHALSAAHGEVRLHVPLTSPPGTGFTLDGAEVVMAPGECWYLDLTLPHTAHNPAESPRIHLVIDCVVDAWLAAFLEAPASAGASSTVRCS
jgi:hypothetical protein